MPGPFQNSVCLRHWSSILLPNHRPVQDTLWDLKSCSVDMGEPRGTSPEADDCASLSFLHACSDSSSLHSQSLRGERCLDKLVLSHVNVVSPNESDTCAYVLQRKNASVKPHMFVSAYKYLWHARYVLVDLDQTTHRVLRTCPLFYRCPIFP